MGDNRRGFYWGWYVVLGAFLILGINYGARYSFGAVVCNSSVAKWFIRKRGMAIGVASIGIGAATMVLAPLAGWVVKVYGWRVGFLGLGGIVLVVGVGLSQWFMGKTRPEDYGLLPDGGGGTETTPILAQASMAAAASGIMGM